MLSITFDKLRSRFWTNDPITIRSHAVKMVIHKAKVEHRGILYGTVRSDVIIETPDGEKHRVHYKHAHFLDEDDKIVEDVPQDLTGRPVEVGSWVCFSERSGETGNCLSIGRVTRILPSGGAKVMVGATGKRYVGHEVMVTTTEKTLVLPVDASALSLMILADFDRAFTKDIGA